LGWKHVTKQGVDAQGKRSSEKLAISKNKKFTPGEVSLIKSTLGLQREGQTQLSKRSSQKNTEFKHSRTFFSARFFHTGYYRCECKGQTLRKRTFDGFLLASTESKNVKVISQNLYVFAGKRFSLRCFPNSLQENFIIKAKIQHFSSSCNRC